MEQHEPFSQLCGKTGADVTEVSRAMGTDSWIGAKFMGASFGFTGSCFRKDLLSVVYIGESEGMHEDILNLVYICESGGRHEDGTFEDLGQWGPPRRQTALGDGYSGALKTAEGTSGLCSGDSVGSGLQKDVLILAYIRKSEGLHEDCTW